MELVIEVDSRQNCNCSVNSSDFPSKLPFIRVADSGLVFQVLNDRSVKPGTLRMSKDFAKCVGVTDGQTVTAHDVLTKPPRQSSPIVVRPASIDDWEVVESLATVLEASILSQIQVVSPGMRFPVWTSRGHKPIILEVDVGLEADFQILTVDSEIAVESRTRDVVDLLGDIENRKYLRARIIDSGFPSVVDRPELLGVGMVVNTKDFISSFGPGNGCLMTIRDRPDILTVVACDSSLVDPGVVLISRCLRDLYGLRSGDRVVLESQKADINSDLIIPKRLIIGFDKNVPERKRLSIFTDFIDRAKCIIVTQGGYIELPNETSVSPRYAKINFESALDGVATSKVAAIITPKQLQTSIMCTFVDLPEVEKREVARQPFLKYVPEKLKEDALKYGIISREQSTNQHIIPSYRPLVARIHEFMESSFVNADPALPFVGSLLLESGVPRAGKTSVVWEAISTLDPPIPAVRIDCCALSLAERYRLAEVEATISGLIRFAFESPPMILFFDDVDQLLVDGSDEPESERDARRSSRGKVLCDFMQDLIFQLRPNRSMFLIGTAVRDSPLLSRLFVHKERIPTHLTSADRKALVGDQDLDPSEKYSFMELVELARTGNDNRELRRRLMANQSTAANKVTFESTARLGGLSAQTRTLIDAISLPLQYPFLFRGNKSLASSGAFVIGPSGAGKSALVDYVVRQVNLPVEIVRGPDLLDKYIGASEQAVRRVFEKAASIAPCVIVFDTIDALCPRRGAESTGVTDRVVNQMLCYLDGVDKVENVFVVAISSRPDMVDPALTRPGRLDLVVVCDVPTVEEKKEIIAALWEDYMSGSPNPSIIEEIAWSLDPTCTGADIKAGFVNAKIIASRTSSEVTEPLLVQCMRELKPSISKKDADMYKEVLARYKGDTSAVVDTDLVGTRVMLH